MAKQKALFIVNPVSGRNRQEQFRDTLPEVVDALKYSYDIVYTEYSKHATEISSRACADYDLVVAVGGDGTVNEVAKGLINSNCTMGIIPVGSGNGLARHLRIPMKLKDAISVINKGKSKIIDTASVNGERFVNVAGIGFDAYVAHEFAKTQKRGAIPYVKIATHEFQNYKSEYYKVSIDGKSFDRNAFLISFANSAQFGNNAYISPHAIIDDGMLDVCMLEEFPIIDAGNIAIKLFNKSLDKSKYMNIVKGKTVTISSESNMKGHIDGEPIIFDKKIEVKIHPASLKIIYNDNPTMIETISKKIKKYS